MPVMTKAISQTAAALCSQLGRGHCHFVGNATTAIYVALRAIGRPGRMLMPASICPNPANAAVYAGYEPAFCDTDLKTLNFDTQAAFGALAEDAEITVILAAHLYGTPCDIDVIADEAKRRGILVIEDAAQAFGADLRGHPCGSFGDLSVLSFGADKILELGGGGALLHDRDDLAPRIEAEIAVLAEKPADHAQMLADYRSRYYSIQRLARDGLETTSLFAALPSIFRRMYLYAAVPQELERIAGALPRLPADIEARSTNARLYRELLRHPAIDHVPVPEERRSAWWRYSFIYRGTDREGFFDEVRARSIDISGWYPPIHRWYGSEARCPNADHVGRHVVNLWTTPRKTPAQVRADCAAILEILGPAPSKSA